MAISSTRKAFNEAFRSAADSGAKTFEFEGKSYSTKMAPEKTTSSRGGARMKSGTDIMDTLPKVGKVDRSELEDYDITPKQKIGFKAEDMGMGQYSMPKGSSFIPGETDKPQSKLPGRFPTRDQRMEITERSYKKGGMVKAKRTSKRGCGIATKGFGKAGGK